jgi:hypothetical protein
MHSPSVLGALFLAVAQASPTSPQSDTSSVDATSAGPTASWSDYFPWGTGNPFGRCSRPIVRKEWYAQHNPSLASNHLQW